MIGTVMKQAKLEPATTQKAGLVKPDGITITIDADGTAHSTGGGDLALGDVSGATASVTKEVVSLTWSDPSDVILDGVVLATWAGTKVVRKIGSAPSSFSDGTLIADVKVRNTYASSPLTDNTVEYGNVYYYRFFPYTTRNTYTDGTALNVTPTREVISLPVQSGTVTYSGSSQEPSWTGYDTNKMTIGGTTSGTNAGDYTATFTPKHDYMWSDNTVVAKDATWTISKANGSVTLSSNAVTLDPDHLTATVTFSDATGTVSVISASPSDVSVSLSSNTITLSAESENSGSVDVTVSVAASSNYNAGSAVIAVTMSFIDSVLDNNSWSTISSASAAGTASSVWAVGDRKKITLNGKVGTLSLSNYDTYIYILGFDHNSSVEGSGISFGGFKTALSGGKDVCLIDSNYSSGSTDGTKYFNMQHWGNYNYGGWKGCDLRYDILGSTDTAPSGYGSQAQSGRTGYDASSTTATSPVSNTLMAALPSDLRAVMKSITKYTDNVAGGSSAQANVTSSIDYLPLLAEYEFRGSNTLANYYEITYQAQYQYYINGNSKVKYRHSSTSSTARWWCRSAYYSSYSAFCYVGTNGSSYADSGSISHGLAVALLV